MGWPGILIDEGYGLTEETSEDLLAKIATGSKGSWGSI
jgi:hypothetical protein